MSGYGQPLLLDWSAYTRYLLAAKKGPGDGLLNEEEMQRFEDALLGDELIVSPPFRFEVLYSEQSHEAFQRRSSILDALPQAAPHPDAINAALEVQATLAASKQVSHRVKFPDAMIAVIAAHNGAGVLHYDKDFKTLSEHSDLPLPHVYVAEPGSLN